MIKNNITGPISEVFLSVQGEGQSLGIPVTFVRFFGCNLRCQFKGKNCDTSYAVLKGNKKLMTVKQVYDKIKKLDQHRIIFTGGEPMLYQSFILDFIKYANQKKKDYYIFEVETNGTLPVYYHLRQLIDVFNVSIKLKSSNQETEIYEHRRINYTNLKTYPTIKTNFKFVISNEKQDKKEIYEILEHILPSCVYLMPEGCTREEVLKNSIKVVNMCIRNGFYFSPREHINIWNMKKGV